MIIYANKQFGRESVVTNITHVHKSYIHIHTANMHMYSALNACIYTYLLLLYFYAHFVICYIRIELRC